MDVTLSGPLGPERDPLWLEVTYKNAPGQDGTLANDLRVDSNILSPRDSNPLVFTTSLAGTFRRSPGTYYFQISSSDRSTYFKACDGTTLPPPQFSVLCPGYQSQVYTWTVGTPPVATPPPAPTVTTPTTRDDPRVEGLALSTALIYARRYAARRLGVRKAKVSCRRTDQASFDCRVSWRRNGKRKQRLIQVYRESGRVGATVAY